MDFIERFLRISPDGGSGLTELIWFTAALFTIVSVLFRKRVISAAWRHLTGGGLIVRRE